MTDDEILDICCADNASSEIEAAFLKAYMQHVETKSRFDGGVVNLCSRDSKEHTNWFSRFHGFPMIQQYTMLHKMRVDFVWSQVRVSGYRADYVIGSVHYAVDFSTGEPGDEILVRSPLVIVECDGPEHSRIRDNPRDRVMMAHGYRVIRFCNEEIRENAARCAEEASELIERLVMEIASTPRS